MANAIYPKYKQSVLTEADTNNGMDGTSTSAPYVALESATYTYSSSHQFYSSLAGIVGTDQALTTPTVTNGTFACDNTTFTAVSGSQVTSLVIYRHNSGANTTWRLVCYLDTSVTGLPVTPNGGNIVITWNGSGVFTISDVRTKENIEAIGEIRGLPVYEYNYRGDSRKVRGFLAQEVQAKYPEYVITHDCGLLAVNYDGVLAA
jgi:hypothetical protein